MPKVPESKGTKFKSNCRAREQMANISQIKKKDVMYQLIRILGS